MKLREQRSKMILGRWQRAGPGAMFTPVVFVLRAKKNHRSCVEGGSRGEKEVELSLPDLQFFFWKGSKEMVSFHRGVFKHIHGL